MAKKIDRKTGMVASDWYKQYPTRWLTGKAETLLLELAKPGPNPREVVRYSKANVEELTERGLAQGDRTAVELTRKGHEWAAYLEQERRGR